jgi:hypothetical protein
MQVKPVNICRKKSDIGSDQFRPALLELLGNIQTVTLAADRLPQWPAVLYKELAALCVLRLVNDFNQFNNLILSL